MFAQMDICPKGQLPRETIAQNTFAQRDVCPERLSDDIWSERHLIRNTIGPTIIEQKYIYQK
jgi:hypothetical protein